MRRVPRVALLIETSKAYGRGLLRGLGQYIRLHGPWSTYQEERGLQDPPPEWLANWDGDGVITRINLGPAARELARRKVPVINLRPQLADLGYPAIFTDSYRIGERACEHFLERGYRRFGYVGQATINWSSIRYDALTKRAAAEGCECRAFFLEPAGTRDAEWEPQQQRLAEWIAALPPPAAVLASHDEIGLRVLDACRRVGRIVPEQLAVLGVDNDVELCELADPALSSIEHDVQQIGFAAGALLERLMRGEAPPPSPQYVLPQGVVLRESTDTKAIGDADIAKALRFIRRHAVTGIGVEDVVQETHLSRRSLERRFRQWVGCAPHEEILRVKLDRVQRLLRETEYKLGRIAVLAGFSDEDYLCAVFKRKLGRTPSEYRKDALP